MTDIGLENLSIGIVKQACDDWMAGHRRIIKLNEKIQNPDLSYADKVAIKHDIDRQVAMIENAERFLRSGDYKLMCNIPCEKMLKMLTEKVESEKVCKKNTWKCDLV